MVALDERLRLRAADDPATGAEAAELAGRVRAGLVALPAP